MAFHRVCVVALLAATACGDNAHPFSVIVFTRQTEWMHTSNPLAADALVAMGAKQGWEVEVADDPAVFTKDRLDRTDVVVFSITSGNILDDTARSNLEPFFKDGHGFVGIHSASYTEFDWTFYRTVLLPVSFKTHPAPANGAPSNILDGTLDLLDAKSPIVRGLPNPWLRPDEFYTFNERPEDIPGLHLLIGLDESTMGPDYPDAVRVGFHPLTFTHENSGTRVFYTALGHTDESYSDPDFLRLIQQGIEWAGRR